MTKDLNRCLTKEDIQMIGKHRKKRFTTYLIREMQIKTSCFYASIEMAKIQNADTTK